MNREALKEKFYSDFNGGGNIKIILDCVWDFFSPHLKEDTQTHEPSGWDKRDIQHFYKGYTANLAEKDRQLEAMEKALDWIIKVIQDPAITEQLPFAAEALTLYRNSK